MVRNRCLRLSTLSAEMAPKKNAKEAAQDELRGDIEAALAQAAAEEDREIQRSAIEVKLMRLATAAD